MYAIESWKSFKHLFSLELDFICDWIIACLHYDIKNMYFEYIELT